MGLFRSLTGEVLLELTSADVAGSLRSINEQGIRISDIQTRGELTMLFTASRRSVTAISKIAEKKGDRLVILKKTGLFWPFWAFRHRIVLIAGMLLLLFLAFFLPSRVLFVEVTGNEQVPDLLILEAAQDAGIRFCASRRAVRSEKMKNALLEAVPQLQWAGVNTYGCTAVISVREREAERTAPDDAGVSNLIAACDGVITSCTVTSGSALCEVGQAVQKGETLISGYVDCGQVITATCAQGEIFARTEHSLAVVTPSETVVRGHFRSRKINFSLQIGKKRINFMKGSGISDSTCVKMYSKYCLALPGGYRLPVMLIKETVISCDLQKEQRIAADVERVLSAFAKSYLRDQMVALTIENAKEVFGSEGGSFCLLGRYACVEMIGREQREQIGDFHGKTD